MNHTFDFNLPGTQEGPWKEFYFWNTRSVAGTGDTAVNKTSVVLALSQLTIS